MVYKICLVAAVDKCASVDLPLLLFLSFSGWTFRLRYHRIWLRSLSIVCDVITETFSGWPCLAHPGVVIHSWPFTKSRNYATNSSSSSVYLVSISSEIRNAQTCICHPGYSLALRSDASLILNLCKTCNEHSSRLHLLANSRPLA